MIDLKSRADQIYEHLLKSISEMKPGDNKLPSEDELAVQFGVSRATIREALKMLLRNGFIKTVHGKGTFGLPSVVHMKMRTNLNSSFMDFIKQEYKSCELQIEWLGFQKANPSLAPLLPDKEAEVHATNWLYYAAGAPVIWGESNVLKSAFSQPPKEDSEILDLPQFAFRYLNNPMAYISYCVKCAVKPDVAQRFGIDPETPLVYWEEKYYDLLDYQFGAGIYYFHPEKIYLQTTISVEKINHWY